MATFTSTRAASSFPVAQSHIGGALQVAYGTIEVLVNPVAADIYEICKVPAGATIVGGMFYADDLDTNATETLDLDLGWAANGGSGTFDSADPDGLGNLGVLTGDAFAAGNVSNVVGIMYPFSGNFTNGDLPTFTAATTIQVETIVTAATFAAGALSLVVYYTTD